MELYACGFNAWNQLHIDGNDPDEPYDLLEFKSVFTDPEITVLRAGLSSTLRKYG
jgi:hypothetical protein